MKYKIKVYSIWEFGKRKDADGNPHQEDCTYPLPRELKDSDRTFILCDGMGGHDAGEIASAAVCQAMGKYILNDGHDSDGIFTDEDLNNAIAAAFEDLDKKDNGAEKKMGTTMTFLKLHNEGATIAHIGDSRVYHIRPGKDGDETQILFETEDHSLVNDLVKIGELTREEAHLSNQKNVITRAMQPNMDRRPKAEIKHITDIKAGDYFYMCSDGMLEDPDMDNGKSLRNIFSEMVDSPERKVEILTDVTEDNRDNHTALIILVEEVLDNIPRPLPRESDVSSKRMGIIEEEEVSENKNSWIEATYTIESKDDVNEDSTKEKSMVKTSSDDHPIERDTKANVNKTASQDKTDTKSWHGIVSNTLPHQVNQSNPQKLIYRFIIAAILVAAVIIFIRQIPSCSKKQKEDKIESLFNKENQEVRKPSSGRNSEQHVLHQQGAQTQEQNEEVALEVVNSDAAQIAIGEDTIQTVETSLPTIEVPAISLPLATEEVVDSDEQLIYDEMKKK